MIYENTNYPSFILENAVRNQPANVRQRKHYTALAMICGFIGYGTAACADAQDAYNWTGVYLGGNAGYATGTSNKEVTSTGKTSGDFTVDGAIGGLTAGYNAQWDALVFGLEGDISESSVEGNHACAAATYTCETDSHWLGTVRPRIGYAFGNFMPYVTGGLAVGDVRVHSFLNNNGNTQTTDDKSQVGWTAGGGVEAAINAKWSLKAEYLYVDLSKADTYTTGGAPTKTAFDENVVKLGVNYRF